MRLFKRRQRRSAHLGGTGRLSQKEVYSYHARRQNEPTRPVRTRSRGERRVAWQRIPELLAFGVVLVCVGYLLSLNTQPRIVVPSSINASLLRSQSEYQVGAHTILNASLLSYSKLTINTASFRRQMLDKYPELADVSVALPLTGRRPIVEIIPEQPALILSGHDGQTYIVDKRGRVDALAKDVKGTSSMHLPLLIDESNVQITPGKNILGKSDIDFITTVLQQLSAAKITITSISLPALPDELHMKLKDTNYYIKFSFKGDARLQSGTLIATLNKLKADSIHPAEYIDVRVEERAYFK